MYLHTNPLQSAQPRYDFEQRVLYGGGSRFHVDSHTVSAPNRTGSEALHMTMVNGMFEDRSSWGPLIGRLVSRAKATESQLKIETYDDSSPRSVDNILDFRAERLAQVINASRNNGSQILNAHSRGWISAVLAAGDADVMQNIGGLFGAGIAGVTPYEYKQSNFLNLQQMALSEVLSTVSDEHYTESSAAYLSLMSNIGFAFSWLNVGNTLREVRQILSADIRQDTADLSEVVPTMIWIHEKDATFSADAVVRGLLDNGYKGNMRIVPTNHIGSLVDPNLSFEMYDDATDMILRQAA